MLNSCCGHFLDNNNNKNAYHILSFVSLSLKSILFYPVSVMFFVFVVVFEIKQRTTVSMSGWGRGGGGGGGRDVCLSFIILLQDITNSCWIALYST